MTRAVSSSPAGQIAQRLDKAIPLLWAGPPCLRVSPGLRGACPERTQTRPARGASKKWCQLVFVTERPAQRAAAHGRRNGRFRRSGRRPSLQAPVSGQGTLSRNEAKGATGAFNAWLQGIGPAPGGGQFAFGSSAAFARIRTASAGLSETNPICARRDLFALFARKVEVHPRSVHCRFRMMLQGRGRGSETKPIAPAAPSERAVRVFSARRSSTPAVIAQI